MTQKTVPNGIVQLPTEIPSTLPPIVGINYGNSYASIAVFTKEGVAECIANEDGERQIASAISFSGEEIYIGNQAIQQLVKNAPNTITGFRNLLGKKFSQIPQSNFANSAPVIQHPDISDEPAYKVQVLLPAPWPLSQGTPLSNFQSPVASQLATPRSEPVPAERILTVSEVNTMFIRSLVKSAEDFVGKSIQGAVITVPTFFDEAQKDALVKVANDAGVRVLQLLDEAGAAMVTTTSDLWSSELHPDRTQLIVDLGASSLSLTLLSIRHGLAFVLASSATQSLGGNEIDDKLITFFGSDFTKKTKTPLSICPSTSTADQRAEAKLRLAIEHTKRTISASPGAATCSVESLKDGLDYTGAINRMRFDLVARPVYAAVAEAISALLASAAIDPHHVDEIAYVGGSTCLPGLDEHLIVACGFDERIESPFARGTVIGGGVGDPTTVLARGCAIQAALLAGIPDDEAHAPLFKAYAPSGAGAENQVNATTKTIGVLIPGPGAAAAAADAELGGTWVPIVHKETALPARRRVRLDAEVGVGSKRLVLEVWEVTEVVKVEKVTPPRVGGDEEEEEVEVKHRVVKKESYLGSLDVEARLAVQVKGKGMYAGKWTTTVEIQLVIDSAGKLKADLKEIGGEGARASLTVGS